MPQSRSLPALSALVATYFAHIGFFSPYLPLWLKEMGLSLVAISVMVSLQSASRMFAPYGWGWLCDTRAAGPGCCAMVPAPRC